MAFPTFRSSHQDALLKAATLPSVFGAISASSWIYAAFIGVAKPLTNAFGWRLHRALRRDPGRSVAVTMAVVLVRPRLASRLGQRATDPGRHGGLAASYFQSPRSIATCTVEPAAGLAVSGGRAGPVTGQFRCG